MIWYNDIIRLGTEIKLILYKIDTITVTLTKNTPMVNGLQQKINILKRNLFSQDL
jgi:hypothetical protein